ncbi:glycosyltransferase family 4 protein [Cupriavidus pampae]|uniref:GalNAc-alpha-(1->4)-GalNAc-alpha-(1->3)-diNAcBac-PP-undecaprenol alpha-1,4-N-acetyl-D-galactosaminyltransferase n=1 Tax=Cupriavidus pampae TaxID=659251 RepID=A0ABM8WQ63_9BURK|nr:glycosyltransferase family 4 protein [Cupriavidus pampae]CAG9169587.1 GalNAc-alpha-(1->4)-GalNAc-alpha-(1->3)-diNAcBac-PP-undecaprenol alpha-1,4-N-acetyl-D-galactosaminyltransferase [Cupriavidus pampae]
MTTLPTVCFLTGTLNAFAGAERMTAVIANGLAERGYRVLILSLYDRAGVFPLHANVVHHALFEARPSFKREYLATVMGIRRFVRTHEVDVLVEVDTMLTLFTVPATLGLDVRRIAWEHCHFDQDLGRRTRRLARRLAARYDDAVVVLTERDRLRWQQSLHPRSKVVVVPNAIPFPVQPAPVSGDARTVIAVGRLVPEKGFDMLLQAWKIVAPLHPDWKLVIVGEGEERDALARQIRSLGLESAVELPGATQDIGAQYRNASILCMSSRYEGFGLVLVEAMAFGLSVISTNCETGPREIIRDGENGLLVDVDDAAAMAGSIRRLIEDDDLRRHLASNGQSVAQRYDAAVILEAWQSVLAR